MSRTAEKEVESDLPVTWLGGGSIVCSEQRRTIMMRHPSYIPMKIVVTLVSCRWCSVHRTRAIFTSFYLLKHAKRDDF